MSLSGSKNSVERMLSLANIKVNGPHSWDIKVHNDQFYPRVLAKGAMGFGESYMDGWWDCDRLDEFFYKIFHADIEHRIKKDVRAVLNGFCAKFFNHQRKQRALRSVSSHYNIGNDLYQNMLDERMTYTCGYWKDARDLEAAQEAKLDLVCKKIGLKSGMTVLDVGCGWGSFAKFAAEKYNATIVGVTISKEQVALAKKTCQSLPVEIRFQDYRDLNEKFDRIISLGMFEHVGRKNYRNYMKVVCRCLKDDGLFLLHTIGCNRSSVTTDSWLNKYIFPDGMLPSAKQITSAAEGLFVLQDWHCFGEDYDKTLMAWNANFEKNWNRIKEKYDQRFYRMWSYYLLSCAGGFRSRTNQLWQVLFSKNGFDGEIQTYR